jgi:kynurenine 3-monooxygenase
MATTDHTAGTRTPTDLTVIGAGLAGSLMATLLARRGHRVRLFERLPDMRRTAIPAGRSINLALAARGIRALERAGVMHSVLPLLIPMRGRLLHDRDGALTFLPYGQREHEVIYSISRPGLNRVLLDAAEAAGVDILFEQTLTAADLDAGTLTFADPQRQTRQIPLANVLGADGAGSVLRHAFVAQRKVRCTEDLLPHGYKEFTIAADADGRHRMERNALHIWPRGGFMLIALPNLDGSFTVTLFLPNQGPLSFAALDTPAAVERLFAEHFADAYALMPDVAEQFAARPTGIMGTVRCARWSDARGMVLLGDAAHAITPFHGQGMNCAFEDCRVLDEILEHEQSWPQAFGAFETQRRPNANAIADMALENYIEMRDTVRDPKFQLQKMLSLELERRFPQRFVPRYSMVMFHDDIPYSVAYERGRIQADILAQLTREADTLAEVNFGEATRLITEQLPPLW